MVVPFSHLLLWWLLYLKQFAEPLGLHNFALALILLQHLADERSAAFCLIFCGVDAVSPVSTCTNTTTTHWMLHTWLYGRVCRVVVVPVGSRSGRWACERCGDAMPSTSACDMAKKSGMRARSHLGDGACPGKQVGNERWLWLTTIVPCCGAQSGLRIVQ